MSNAEIDNLRAQLRIDNLRAQLRREQDERAALRVELNELKVAMHEKLDIATDAITYALNRVGTDAEFAYHMLYTETLDRLIRAYATIRNRDVIAVRREILERARKLPQSRCQTDKDFVDGGGHV